jgi:hypothetical protein
MRLCVSSWDRCHNDFPEFGPFGLDPEADRNGARQLWSLVSDSQLSDTEAEALGTLLHYGLGASAGAFYTLLPDRAHRGFGSAYGGAVWLLGDLAAVSFTGVSDPRSKTFGAHVVAFVAHLLFGMTTEAGVRLLNT